MLSLTGQAVAWSCWAVTERATLTGLTHGRRSGEPPELAALPRRLRGWPLRPPHARVARPSTEAGERGGSTTRRRAFGDWALGLVESAARTAGTLGAVFLAFYTGAKISVIGQPRLPELPAAAANAVGSQVSTIGGLRCRLLYPARSGAAGAPEAPYLTEGTRTSDAMARLVFFPGFLLEHLGVASSGCLQDAPPSAADPQASGGYPVLVYSHGQGGNMDMGTYFLRAIASCGVVVASVEHQDGSASTADGQNPRPFNITKGQLGVRARASEVVQVAEALQAPAAEDGGKPLAARWGGDANSIFVGGHSYGGPTALIAASARPELFRGLVLHDPATTDSPQPPLPVFSVVGDQYVNISPLAKEVRRVSTGQVQPAAVAARPGFAWAGAWHYEGISHGNFVDAPLWAPLLIMRALGLLFIPAAGPAEPAEAHTRLAVAAASFMAACCDRSPVWGDRASVQALPEKPFVRL